MISPADRAPRETEGTWAHFNNEIGVIPPRRHSTLNSRPKTLPTVLNLGSANIDYVYHVDRFVAPGETLRSNSLVRGAGGKGFNQSIALTRAGARVAHAGCIGREAAWLREQLAEEKIDVTRFTLVDEAPGHAIIQVTPSGQNAILLSPGANYSLAAAMVPALFCGLGPHDWFLTQNETSCVPEAIHYARRAGLTVCFNPAPMHDDVREFQLGDVDWLFVNESEGEALTNKHEPAAILAGLRRLTARAHLVLTLGAEGAWCVPPTGKGAAVHCAAPQVHAVDTTGAGDTFIGFFIAALIQDHTLAAALELACRAAALSVTRLGAAASIPFARELSLNLTT
jgi:ribokinase